VKVVSAHGNHAPLKQGRGGVKVASRENRASLKQEDR